MTHTIHQLVERYGLIAVFVGCMAEGESVAVLAGFFAHQNVFVPWQAFAASFIGAFAGDTAFFVLGRSFADRPWVARMRTRPGFSHAYKLVLRHPNVFVLGNRFIYGMRLVGGIAAGLSGIPLPRFMVLNLISSAIWATLFCGLGYVFGLGAAQVIGRALVHHERLLIALAVGLAVAGAAFLLAHHVANRERRREF